MIIVHLRNGFVSADELKVPIEDCKSSLEIIDNRSEKMGTKY